MVNDAYADWHTGLGRGFSIFYLFVLALSLRKEMILALLNWWWAELPVDGLFRRNLG